MPKLPIHRLPCSTLNCLFSIALVAPALLAQEVKLPRGTALRVTVDRRFRSHTGGLVEGHLTEPVFLVDREVIPAGALIRGRIEGQHPGSKRDHVIRLLAGDFTPPLVPEIVFDTITLPNKPGSSITISAPAVRTDANTLTLGVQRKKRSLLNQIGDAVRAGKDAVRSSVSDAKDTARHPHLAERVEKWAIGQLPYHPEMIWTGTCFNADLAVDVSLPADAHVALPIEDLEGRLPQGTLHARLLESVTSETAKHGDAVEAITTQPLLSSGRTKVLVPEGTLFHGVVAQAKPARSFGRNGSLRFTFRSLDLKTAQGNVATTEVHGRLSSAQTDSGAHVSMDEEGQVKANDGPAKVAEPLLLGALALAATPDEHDQAEGGVGAGTTTVASNGFGLIARITSLATLNTGVLQGFAYFSLGKSVYFHYLARGHNTAFAKDTEIEVTLSER